VSSEFITVAIIRAMVIGTRFLMSASTAMGRQSRDDGKSRLTGGRPREYPP
jgi:hypothetical protein